jgi:hypothetical protein|tara:strand:+ start:7938 stop:8552 length:615 start_codon:yes stop_codon:yes gene_type:complete
MEEQVFELFIDESHDMAGIEAISIVENPAIEEDFIYLSKSKVVLQSIDVEKRLLMGAALVPDKKILRRNADGEYYIFFSKDTVRRASELFLMNGNQSKSTLEHEVDVQGLTVVESWIIEDSVNDKSKKYGLSLPIGTWMVSVKVNNDEIWNDYVKTGAVKGFSIEGFFSDNLDERPLESIEESGEELAALETLRALTAILLDNK